MFNQPNNSFWVLTAEVCVGVLVLFLPLIFFNEELIALMSFLSQKVGPTLYILMALSSYILGGIIWAFFETDHRKLPKLLEHLSTAAGLCLTVGMIGTYISFVGALGHGMPEPKHFANALFSTLWALGIIALVTAVCEVLRVIGLPYSDLNWGSKNDK